MTKEINLTQGMVAIVSDEDYDFLIERRWYLTNSRFHPTAVSGRKDRPSGFIQMHHAVIERMGLDRGELVVDHINHNSLDNRRENLRLVTHVQNRRNSRARKDTVCGFKGVTYRKGRGFWIVQLLLDGRMRILGSYYSAVVAAVRSNDIMRERDGEFASLNEMPSFIEELARQYPDKAGKIRGTKLEIAAQRAHAAMVDAAYANWQAQQTTATSTQESAA